jgi:hypothetical protein
VDRIEVTVSGMFTTHHTFHGSSGPLGELIVPAFGRRAVFRSTDGRESAIRHTSWWSGRYEMSIGEEVVGRAHARGAFKREIVVDFGGDSYSVVPAGAFRLGWYLETASGIRLIEYQVRGALRRGAYLEILASIDVELIVFFYYLVFQRKQEEAAAASAAAS